MAQPATHIVPQGVVDKLRLARQIIAAEARALDRLATQLPLAFADVVEYLANCRGSVIVTGIGKAGWIAQKISASLASTGTRSHYLHPSEAMHGDLGRVGPDDVVLALSNSGQSAEVLQILPSLKRLGVRLVAMTGNAASSLALEADLVLDYGRCDEACPLGVAPSTSTTMMLALGDALALVTSRVRQFQLADFAQLHPGGSIGQRLSTVDQIMRPLSNCRVAHDDETIRQIYVRLRGPGRRSGALLLTNQQGELTGLFTDSDLARLLESQKDASFDRPICEVMTERPITVRAGSLTQVAVEILACHNISELPVVDADHRPVGLVDITDVVAFLPTNP